MRLFPVPMDLTKEEKLIGGVLSMRQVIYILGGAVFTIIAFFLLRAFHLPWSVRFPVSLLFFVFGLFLSFGNPKDTPADEYLLCWIAWRLRCRSYNWGE